METKIGKSHYHFILFYLTKHKQGLVDLGGHFEAPC